ncbi:uncharacterized protein H6S33_011517 [Morchella sextelata]|uniref:uncharacterized protein n=1 Tax=Morchella sextelata TaxID=1174677 RepID=UPI001D03CF0C|nr:uncharacterized protein H6S33_011517 [Morchella sextelata]KAH0611090.1 hypothetical protein H6S33_011517 [Morchella sextelata]
MSNYATEVEAILAAARARGGYEYEADQEGDVYDNDVDQTYDAHGPSMAGYASEDGEDEEEQDGEDQDGEYGSRYAHNEVLARALGVPGFGEEDTVPIPAQGLFFTQSDIPPLAASTSIPAQGLFFTQASDSSPSSPSPHDSPPHTMNMSQSEDDDEEYDRPPTPDLSEYDSEDEENAKPRWER